MYIIADFREVEKMLRAAMIAHYTSDPDDVEDSTIGFFGTPQGIAVLKRLEWDIGVCAQCCYCEPEPIQQPILLNFPEHFMAISKLVCALGKILPTMEFTITDVTLCPDDESILIQLELNDEHKHRPDWSGHFLRSMASKYLGEQLQQPET